MKTERLHTELIGREFHASIADVVRMAYGMKLGERVWGKPLHSEAMKLPGVVKHKGAWFAPAFDLAELIVSKTELSNFEEAVASIIENAEATAQELKERTANKLANIKEQARKDLAQKAALEKIRKARRETQEEWREFDINELRKRAWESVDIKQRNL